jgi:hypothetical protein
MPAIPNIEMAKLTEKETRDRAARTVVRAETEYRDAIMLFARKLSPPEQILLFDKMREKTAVSAFIRTLYCTDGHFIGLNVKFGEGEAFHEALHFLDGEGVIKDKTEKIPTAAGMVYEYNSMGSLLKATESENASLRRRAKIVLFLCKLFDSVMNYEYWKGYNLMVESFKLLEKQGGAAAWNHLYSISQQDGKLPG